MPAKIIFAMIFLLQAFPAFTQGNYDTLIRFVSFSTPYESRVFEYDEKETRKYNTKGQLTSIEVSRADVYTRKLLRSYKLTYTYGPNDSLKTSTYMEIPKGYTDWKTTEVSEYSYKGNLLHEVSTKEFALTDWMRETNKIVTKLRTQDNPGIMAVWDTSGWTSNRVTKYQYDGQNRLIKKAFYSDINDDVPAVLWTYTFDGKDLPEENTSTYRKGILRSAYHYLYKGGQLQEFRHDNYKSHILSIKTDEYSYGRDGKLEKIYTTHQEMKRMRVGNKEAYRTSEKKRLFHKQYLEYNGELVSAVREESAVPYTVNKRTFWDGLASVRTSTSTTRYGDMERTTTTTTVVPSGTTEKTKYNWEKETTQYQYDATGRLVMKKNWGNTTTYTYDSKGRLVEVLTLLAPDPDGKTSITARKTVYRYNK